MPWVKIAINEVPYKNVDSISDIKNADALFDGYVDEAGNSVKRPGLSAFVDLSTSRAVDGLFWWDAKGVVIAVSQGNIYSIDSAGNKTDLTGDKLSDTGGRTYFASDGKYVIMTNGGRMVYTDGVNPTNFIQDKDAPVNVSRLDWIDGYVLASDSTSPSETPEGESLRTLPELAQGESGKRVSNVAFIYLIAGTEYNETAETQGTALPFDEIAVGKHGVWSIEIGHHIVFTVSGVGAPIPKAGTIYSNNSSEFTVMTTDLAAGSGTITTYRSSGTNDPTTSGTLTKVNSGQGDASITFSSFSTTEGVLDVVSGSGNMDIAFEDSAVTTAPAFGDLYTDLNGNIFSIKSFTSVGSGGVIVANLINKRGALASNSTLNRITGSGDAILQYTSATKSAGGYDSFVDAVKGVRQTQHQHVRLGRIIVSPTSTIFIGDVTRFDATGVTATFTDESILGPVTNKVHFSGEADGEANILSWQNTNFFVAEGNPDGISGVKVNWRKVFVFGPQSTEIFWNDGTTPFARLGGGFVQRGVIAKHSFVEAGDAIYWLDEESRFVVLTGSIPKFVSTPFDKYIQGFGTVSDAIADNIVVDGRTFIVIHFPTEDKTLVYDYGKKAWMEWGEWDTELGDYRRWKGNCYANATGFDKHLVGDKANGKIYELDSSVFQDDGATIRFFRRTGHVNHGTDRKKKSSELIIRVKSGEGTGVTTPYMTIRWRDDGKNKWSNEHFVDLKFTGNTGFTARLHRLGIYRTRQYEIAVTENIPFVLVGMEENIEVLNR